MSYNNIQFLVGRGVATLTFDRPDKFNSFNGEMHAEVRDALGQIDGNDDIRCLLLTGNGRAFCAGQDLDDESVFSPGEMPDLGLAIEINYNPLIRALFGLQVPVVCAVNGVAAGAGANIALACDIVLAARSASFIQAFSKIGLVPDSGGTWILPRLVGQARAMALCMLGDKLSAEQAEKWGMIWRCVDDDDLMNEANALCTHFASQPTQGLALIKQALAASWGYTLDEQLELEKNLQRTAGRTKDYKEGVSAFMEKRPATFRGR